MDTPAADPPLRRVSDWFRATPLELVGLAVLLTGALVASWALWWSATGRPSELPAAVLDVGAGAVSGGAAPIGPGEPADGGPAASGPEAKEGSDPVPEELTVHVTGAVIAPGLVVLAGAARVGEAVAAAGGLTGDADPELINLARVLADGEHVHIPRIGDDPAPDPAPPVAGSGAGVGGGEAVQVDINRAGADELQTLPGIGPARADAIVRHRDANGPFGIPGDLRAVPGIGEATFQRLADLITAG